MPLKMHCKGHHAVAPTFHLPAPPSSPPTPHKVLSFARSFKLVTHLDDLSVLTCCNEALSAKNHELQVQLEAAETLHQLENTECWVADAHATIHNLENQELHCQ